MASGSSGIIQVGGLATGLDTNNIISQLVALEQRPIDLLKQQQVDIQNSESAFSTFGTKLTTLRSAADALNTVEEVLAGSATSSNDSAVSAVAGSGASRGSVTVNVTQLARGSVAGSAAGKAASSDTVASGNGFFKFQVGSGTVQSVPLTASTTLQDLVNGINDLHAGVTASAVNLGTDATPDFRLNVVTRATGESSTITVVQDDTNLAVTTTLSGRNAEFTVSGFSDQFQRETNTFSDVLPGVSFTLKDTASATITVNDDADAITAKVQALVTAYNDVVTFAHAQAAVTQDSAGTPSLGALTANSTVRRLVDQVGEALTGALGGATTQYVNLASVGLVTRAKDEVTSDGTTTSTVPAGTIAFDEGAFRAALADNPNAVAELFAGNGVAAGAGNQLGKLISDATGIGGVLAIDSSGFDNQLSQLQDQIDAGQRNLDVFQQDLRAQFTALETLVSGLQSQGSLLTAAFKNG